MRESLLTILLATSAMVNFFLLWLWLRTFVHAERMRKQRDDVFGKHLLWEGWQYQPEPQDKGLRWSQGQRRWVR